MDSSANYNHHNHKSSTAANTDSHSPLIAPVTKGIENLAIESDQQLLTIQPCETISLSLRQSPSKPRLLTRVEDVIIKSINTCLINWHQPWKKTYFDAGQEFHIVYNLMDSLIHYEFQITSSDKFLPSDRTNAIAQAVARLVDYGNAILGLDLIVRNNDETSSDLDSNKATTIELFHSHISAHKLRQKLLNDYFRKAKLSSSPSTTNINCPEDTSTFTNNGSPSLQVPVTPFSSSQHSPTLSRSSHRSSISSSASINTMVTDPSSFLTGPQISPYQTLTRCSSDLNNIQPSAQSQADLSGQIELTHAKATLRSNAFKVAKMSPDRITILPGILARIEALLSASNSKDKISNCFTILDCLLDSIERLPSEWRSREVIMIAKSLLRPIVQKVHLDEREVLIDYQHQHWATCLISIVRTMKAAEFSGYMSQFSNLADLSSFLRDYLFVVKRLVSNGQLSQTNMEPPNGGGPTYPSCWIEMILAASSILLSSLTCLYQILRQYFATHLQTWQSFMDCLVHFILQETLKPSRVMLKERHRLLAEDLRQTAAEYIWISWDSMNLSQRQNMLEDFVEPLLSAAMTLNSRQRSILLPIFYDMMQCDYTSQYIATRRPCSSGNASLCTLVDNNNSGANSHMETLRSLQSSTDCYEWFPADRCQPPGARRSPLLLAPGGHANYAAEQPISSQPAISMASMLASAAPAESLPYLAGAGSGAGASEDGTVLTKFTHLMVDKLNRLMVERNSGDASFRAELCAALAGQVNPKYYNQRGLFTNPADGDQFGCMARQTADMVAEFMQICLDLRQANQAHYKHLQLLCLFKLILFFRDKVDRLELYLSYLYKLCYLHQAAGAHAEAGYTLLEHAKALAWSERALESGHRVVQRFYQASASNGQLASHASLKTFLYNTIADHFERAQLWEASVPLLRELADHYQFRAFNYRQLVQVLQRLAGCFASISDINLRSPPEYFRVSFYGSGFPACLQNGCMVYRGRAYEKLADFQAAVLATYPDAKLLASLAKPGAALLAEPDARYLQVNACAPVVDLASKLGDNLAQIDESILNYYRHNECDKFAFSRRVDAPASRGDSLGPSGDNFANIWREQTTLTCNTLPGMLPFFAAYLVESRLVSPLESAVEDLRRTNDRLAAMVNRFKADSQRHAQDARALGQLLLGVVDAAVNGGIAKYEEAFFQPLAAGSAREPAPSELEQLEQLKQLIARQVPLLDEALALHGERVADVMRPQHEHLERSYARLRQHVMSRYARYLPAEYARRLSQQRRASRAGQPGAGERRASRPRSAKRSSDVGVAPEQPAAASGEESKVRYKQLSSERRSLPFISFTAAARRGSSPRPPPPPPAQAEEQPELPPRNAAAAASELLSL